MALNKASKDALAIVLQNTQDKCKMHRAYAAMISKKMAALANQLQAHEQSATAADVTVTSLQALMKV